MRLFKLVFLCLITSIFGINKMQAQNSDIIIDSKLTFQEAIAGKNYAQRRFREFMPN